MTKFAKKTKLAKKITSKEFLTEGRRYPIVDVRTAKEYNYGHIPGAVNIPLFTDEERAEVGTAYKKQGKQKAMLIGLEKVGPKMRIIAEQALEIAKDGKLLVHCWRGGMRSESMAWLFERVGIECQLLRGGYKAYRRYAKNELSSKANLIILSGSTGSGKTDVLKELQNLGEQIIDLEGIAHHKGSAFGAIGEKKQHSTEQFENNLHLAFSKLDLKKQIWVEDESKSIGKNFIPDEFFKQMRKAPVLKINIPKQERIKRLVKDYTFVDKEILIYHLNRIKKRLGPKETQMAIESVEKGEMAIAVDISLSFYDKAYAYGLSKRNIKMIQELDLKYDKPKENAQKILEFKIQSI